LGAAIPESTRLACPSQATAPFPGDTAGPCSSIGRDRELSPPRRPGPWALSPSPLPGGFDIIAKGDPLAPQGFNPVERHTIYPGDPLSVTCVFDSTGVDHVVQAGPTHDHEMCNMYLMVYSTLPHIEMCNDGSVTVADKQPGNLPADGMALPDPYPHWKPPLPADKASGKVRPRAAWGPAFSLRRTTHRRPGRRAGVGWAATGASGPCLEQAKPWAHVFHFWAPELICLLLSL
jgi:hypothetical protein